MGSVVEVEIRAASRWSVTGSIVRWIYKLPAEEADASDTAHSHSGRDTRLKNGNKQPQEAGNVLTGASALSQAAAAAAVKAATPCGEGCCSAPGGGAREAACGADCSCSAPTSNGACTTSQHSTATAGNPVSTAQSLATTMQTPATPQAQAPPQAFPNAASTASDTSSMISGNGSGGFKAGTPQHASEPLSSSTAALPASSRTMPVRRKGGGQDDGPAAVAAGTEARSSSSLAEAWPPGAAERVMQWGVLLVMCGILAAGVWTLAFEIES